MTAKSKIQNPKLAMPRVAIELDRNSLNLAPGETAEVRVSVTNRGKAVDAFSLIVTELDPLWYALTHDEVRLFPEDTGEVVLRVHPPSGYGSQAGIYPFTVVAVSLDDPTDRVAGTVILTVASVGEVGITLAPQRVVARKGGYWLTLQNPGNTPRQAVLVLTDPEEALHYTLGTPVQTEATGERGQPPTLTPPTSVDKPIAFGEGTLEHELELPPGSHLTIPLLLRPLKRQWTGLERTFQIIARLHPPGMEWLPDEEKKAEASLVYKPILAGWSGLPRTLRRALMWGVPLAIFALLLFLLLKPSDGLSGPELAASQTATAIALSAAQTAAALALSAEQTAQALSARLTAVTAANGGDVSAANATLTALAMSPEERSAAQTATAIELAAQAESAPFVDKFYLVVPSPTVEGAPTTQATPVTVIGNGDMYSNVGWDVTSAKAIRITQQSRLFDSPDPNLSLIDYTMVATGTGHVATDTLTILLVRPPQIELFTANPTVIPAGGSSTLFFRTRGSDVCIMDGVSMPMPPSGEGTLLVTPPETHIYIHCVENAAGRNCRAVKVTVLPADTPTPIVPVATIPPIIPPTATAAPPQATNTSAPTSTRRPTNTRAPTFTPKPRPSNTPVRPTSTPKPRPSNTPVRTSTPRPPTGTPTRTATLRPTLTPTNTPTFTATPTPTLTETPTASPTNTPTFTHTATATRTSSPTRTSTSTRTSTRTPVRTPTRTATPTCTPVYVIRRDTAPAVGIQQAVDTGNHCDDCVTNINLPFPVSLYDQQFNTAIVGSNGTLSFTNTNAIPDNECLPTSDLEFVILPYWDDLDTRSRPGFEGAGVFTEYRDLREGGIFSIQWNAMNKGTAKPARFVLHFYENSPNFDVVYLGDDGSSGSSATIGVEEAFDSGSGIGSYTQYSCNQQSVSVRTRLTFNYRSCTVIPGALGASPDIDALMPAPTFNDTLDGALVSPDDISASLSSPLNVKLVEREMENRCIIAP